MLQSFNSKKSIPQDCLVEVNKAIKLLREEIKTTYENFEETTSNMINNQKQEF